MKSALLVMALTAVANFPAYGQSATYRIGNFEVTLGGSQWKVLTKGPLGVYLGKLPDTLAQTDQATVTAWAVAGNIPGSNANPQFVLDAVKNFKIQDASTGRMKSISESFRSIQFKGMTCMRFNQSAWDMDKILEVQGLVCLDSKDPRHFIDVQTSTRRAPDMRAPDISAETEMFFNSLRPVQ